jgi:hypothetical protein
MNAPSAVLVNDSPSLARDAVVPSTPTVQHVLGLRGNLLGQRSDLLAVVGQEGSFLIGLQALASVLVPKSAAFAPRWKLSRIRRLLAVRLVQQ